MLAVISMTPLLIGMAYAKDYEVKKAPGFWRHVRVRHNCLLSETTLRLRLRTHQEKYVTDAKVKIDYVMPAMPGMPAMNYKTDTEFQRL